MGADAACRNGACAAARRTCGPSPPRRRTPSRHRQRSKSVLRLSRCGGWFPWAVCSPLNIILWC